VILIQLKKNQLILVTIFIIAANIFPQETTLKLPTNDNTSSFNVTKENGVSLFKVFGNGELSGDGSGFSNVKPIVAYAQGNQSVYFHEGMIPGLNLYEAQIMREVTIHCPGPGIIIAQASGYCDWESKDEDLVRIWFHPHPTVSPTSSWETPDFHNLRIVSDYQCADSSDQYTSWSITKTYTVNSAQDYTVKICADKPFTSSKVLIGDVVLQLIYFPTGGTGGSGSSYFSPEQPETQTFDDVSYRSIDGSLQAKLSNEKEDIIFTEKKGNDSIDNSIERINQNIIDLKNENEMLKKRLTELEAILLENK
jgi:hypothetical protein